MAAAGSTNVLTLSLGDIPNPIRKLALTTFGSAHIYNTTFYASTYIHILAHFAKHVPASIVFLASDRWTEGGALRSGSKGFARSLSEANCLSPSCISQPPLQLIVVSNPFPDTFWALCYRRGSIIKIIVDS